METATRPPDGRGTRKQSPGCVVWLRVTYDSRPKGNAPAVWVGPYRHVGDGPGPHSGKSAGPTAKSRSKGRLTARYASVLEHRFLGRSDDSVGSKRRGSIRGLCGRLHGSGTILGPVKRRLAQLAKQSKRMLVLSRKIPQTCPQRKFFPLICGIFLCVAARSSYGLATTRHLSQLLSLLGRWTITVQKAQADIRLTVSGLFR